MLAQFDESLEDLIVLSDDWLMSHAERAFMEALLIHVQPKGAIEIGTAFGKSLSLINRYAQHTWSLDLDHSKIPVERRRLLASKTSFIEGPSSENYSRAYREGIDRGMDVEFVLIDGDHSRAGVIADINAVLAAPPPKRPLHVLMHDSFNPECRAGIAAAPWNSNPHVQILNLDQVSGKLGPDGMWGGFAYALLTPELRQGDLRITATHAPLFRAAIRASIPHLVTDWMKSKVRVFLKKK